MRFLNCFFLGALAALSITGCATTSSAAASNPSTPQTAAPAAGSAKASATATTVAPTFTLQSFQDTITRVAQKVLPTVVYIEAVQKHNNRQQKVTGSGFIVSDDGYIITNEHVVSNAQKVEVSLVDDKHRYSAVVVGADQQTDIAVLKVDPKAKLPVPAFGDYDSVRVGDAVLAIGNPYGLDGTVSFGIISAKGRNLNVGKLINDFLQTDAMIDRGSSGGPLVNLRGEIVGVNSMGQGRGIGFTIPINTALEVRDRLIKSGSVERGWLGVTVQSLNRDLAGFFEIPKITGAIVTHVISGSPAEAGGLEPEDIIVSIDGNDVDVEDDKDLNNFRRAVAAIEPGAKVPIKVRRDGKEKRLMIVIGEQPKIDGEEVSTTYGFTGQEITASIRLAHRLVDGEGVFVSYVEKDSVAAEAGLQQGEVILEINDERIHDLAEFREVIESVEPGSRFLIKARAGDALRYHLLIPYGKNITNEADK